MNKNVKNGLMVGGGVLLVYWIWKSMQPAATTTAALGSVVGTPATPATPVETAKVGPNFSGMMQTDVVGNRVW
jgi:hypothetical protein